MFLKKFGKKIFICFCLVTLLTCAVFFCLNRPKTVKAEPISVGLTLGAVVMAFLAASGVAITSNSIDENNLDSSLSTMLSGYEKSDLTYEDWVNNIGDYDGLDWLIGRENKAGAVAIGYELMDWLSGLPSWLIGTYGLSSSGDTILVNGGDGIIANGDQYTYRNINSTFNWSLGETVPSIVNVEENATTRFDFENGTYLTIQVYSYNPNNHRAEVLAKLFNSSDNTQIAIGSKSLRQDYQLSTYSLSQCVGIIFGKKNNATYLCLNKRSTTSSQYVQTVVTFDDFLSLNVPISIFGGLTGSIDDEYYQDYQDAVLPDINAQTGNDDAVGVIDLGAGVAEGALTQEQLIQNILDAVYANELDSTWTGVYEDQKTAEEDTDSEKVPTEAEMQGNMVIIDGLEDFFPFCIPFDLYEIIAILNVPAETPQFTYTVSFGGFFGSEDLEIDLSDFETPALIVRTMFIIAFLVFLTLKTRDLIRG